jgi:hypothetical protein
MRWRMPERRIFEDFSADEAAALDAGRKWVLDHCSEAQATESATGKIWLIDGMLAKNLIAPHETRKLQSLGIVFGDALVQELPLLSWQMVTDRFGRAPMLVWEGTSITISPLTMISQRIQGGEQVDIVELFAATCAHIKAVSQNPNVTRRRSKRGTLRRWLAGIATMLKRSRVQPK